MNCNKTRHLGLGEAQAHTWKKVHAHMFSSFMQLVVRNILLFSLRYMRNSTRLTRARIHTKELSRHTTGNFTHPFYFRRPEIIHFIRI